MPQDGDYTGGSLMSGNGADNLKSCSCCGKQKGLAAFYFRENEGRHESRCKDCVSRSKKKAYKMKTKRMKVINKFEIVFKNDPCPTTFGRAIGSLIEEIRKDV